MSIQEVFHEIAQNLEKISEEEQGILFFGNTGSAKTTLVHYIGRNPNLRIESHGLGRLVYTVQQYEGAFREAIISQAGQSQTSVPITVHSGNQVYRDMPGFMDNRNNGNLAIQDLKNYFYFQDVFKKTKKWKIILVASLSEVDQRDLTFSLMLQKIFDAFSLEEWQMVKRCCSLVISKTENEISNDQLNEFFRTKFPQNTKKFEFINFLANQGQILTFPRPQIRGDPNFHHAQIIREKINRLSWAQFNRITSSMISAQTKQLLRQMSQDENKKRTARQVSNNIKKWIQDYFKREYDLMSKAQFKEKLVSYWESLSKLRQSQIIKIQDILKALQQIFQGKINEQLKEFKGFINLLDNIKQILMNHDKNFYEAKLIIEELLKISVNVQPNAKLFFINMKQIAISLQKASISSGQISDFISKNSQISDVFLFLAQQMTFYTDISAHGKSLFLICQNKIIIQSIKKQILIDLSGIKGQAYQLAKDQDGCKGRPGQNGGSLYIKSTNIEKGMIIANLAGGEGGDGQNIEITILKDEIISMIKKDVFRQNSEKIYLSSQQDYHLGYKGGKQSFTYGFKKAVTFNGQILETYRNDTTKAENLVYKKYPGDEGKVGNPGKLIFLSDCEQIRKKIKIQNSISREGSKGTISYDLYEGKYIREKMFDLSKGRKDWNSKFFGFIQRFGHLNEVQTLLDTQFYSPIIEAVSSQEPQLNQVISSINLNFVSGKFLGYCASYVSHCVGLGLAYQSQDPIKTYLGSRGLFHLAMSAISAGISDGWKEDIQFKSRRTKRIRSKPEDEKSVPEKVYEQIMEPKIPIEYSQEQCLEVIKFVDA